jgi:hypothetical protein
MMNSPLLRRQSHFITVTVDDEDDDGGGEEGEGACDSHSPLSPLSALSSSPCANSPCVSPARARLAHHRHQRFSVTDSPLLRRTLTPDLNASPLSSSPSPSFLSDAEDGGGVCAAASCNAADRQHEQHVRACVTPRVSGRISLPPPASNNNNSNSNSSYAVSPSHHPQHHHPYHNKEQSHHHYHHPYHQDSHEREQQHTHRSDSGTNSRLNPSGSGESQESSSGSEEPPSPSSYYRVVVLGDEGVGKTTLVRQMTSIPSCTRRLSTSSGK